MRFKTVQNRDLFRAAMDGNVAGAMAAIARGAEINGTNEDRETALMQAALYENVDMVKFLLSQKVDVNAVDAVGWNAATHAVVVGNKELVKLLAESGADLEVRDKISGLTLIMYAAINNYPEIIDFLIKKGVDKDAVDDEGRSALHYAMIKGSKEAEDFLAASGATISEATRSFVEVWRKVDDVFKELRIEE